jgi:hypothetical protein
MTDYMAAMENKNEDEPQLELEDEELDKKIPEQ